jgi:hypothetical protein
LECLRINHFNVQEGAMRSNGLIIILVIWSSIVFGLTGCRHVSVDGETVEDAAQKLPPKPQLLCVTQRRSNNNKIELHGTASCGPNILSFKKKNKDKLLLWEKDSFHASVHCGPPIHNLNCDDDPNLFNRAVIDLYSSCKSIGLDEYEIRLSGGRQAEADFNTCQGKTPAETKLQGEGVTGIRVRNTQFCLKIQSHHIYGNQYPTHKWSKHPKGSFDPNPPIIQLSDPAGNPVSLPKKTPTSIDLNQRGIWAIKIRPGPFLSHRALEAEASGSANVEDKLRFSFLQKNPDGTCP